MTACKSRWVKSIFASSAFWFGSSGNRPSYRRRLLVEPLEDRCVPATITPTTFADGVLGSGSLRDAVLQFNADAGSNDDTILLQAGTYALTLRNSGGHHETAGLTGDLNLTRASHRWIIQGARSSRDNATIIDAGQLQDRVLQIVTPGMQVVFRDLVIQGGLAQDDGSDGALAGTTDALGGGLLNNGGDVTLENVVLQNNVVRGGDGAELSAPGHNANGGGIYSTGGALTMAGATIANNQVIGGRGGDRNGNYFGGNGGSATGGGLYATAGSLDIANSSIASNRATGGRGGAGYLSYTEYGNSYTVGGGTAGSGQGGGLYVSGGSLTIATSTIASNQGTGGYGGASQGGALYNIGTLTVSNTTLSGNSAPGNFGYGGGIYNGGTLTVSNTTLSGNSAPGYFGYGGGIYNSGTLTVSNSTLSGNSSSGYNFLSGGGGIYNSGTLTVSNSTLSGNTAYSGGGISNASGGLTVSNSTLSGNTALYGGGIYNNSSYGTLTISNSALSGNAADRGAGGGIFNNSYGTLTISNSTLSGNSASGGGGIYNGGTLTVSNSTLSSNTAGASGGGGIENQGTLTVSNSTLSSNSAYYYSGGIFTWNSTNPVTLTNVTVTANRANIGGGSDHGGGLSASSGSPVLHNTLIAGNFNGATGTTRDDVYGALNPGGDYNLIGDGTGMTGLSNGVNGNLVGSATNPIDALLGPLADNGGPTLTHALLSGSPAIDAGNNAYATDWDQRGEGFPRIVNGVIDIGAFEYQGAGSAPLFTRSGRGNEPAVDALLASLPPSKDQPIILSSVPASNQYSTGIETDRVTATAAATWDPEVSSADMVFASFQEKEPGQGAVWWDDLEAADGIGLIGS
jgi:hypothetical protein